MSRRKPRVPVVKVTPRTDKSGTKLLLVALACGHVTQRLALAPHFCLKADRLYCGRCQRNGA